MRNDLLRGTICLLPARPPISGDFRTEAGVVLIFASPLEARGSAAGSLVSHAPQNDMNRWMTFFFVATLSVSASAPASMIRAAGAVDRQTILLEGGAALRLRGVDLPVDEEPAAREYLQRLVAGHWVYVEDGDVYRSPDALFINGEMARRAWKSVTKMTWLGESFPAPPSRSPTRAATSRAPSARSPHRAPHRAPRASHRPARRTSRRVAGRRIRGS